MGKSNSPKFTKAYVQGRKAFINGKPNKLNPHFCDGMNQDRVDWFNGWYDEWRWQKWGANRNEVIPPLNGYKISYPIPKATINGESTLHKKIA
jgi:hypothetical protein